MCKRNKTLSRKDREDFIWYTALGISKRDALKNHDEALKQCIEKAYLDFNRTLEFTHSNDALDKMKKNGGEEGEKAEEYETCKGSWKAECKKLLQGEIEELIGRQSVKQSDFDSWHKELCEKLAGRSQSDELKAYNRALFEETEEEKKEEKKGLTFGHAQKWVNMTLKYMLIMGIPDWKMGNLEPYLHVPIDNYILRYVCKIYKEGRRAYKLSDNICIYADGKIKIGPKEDPKEYSWSKISDYDKHYKPIQDHLMGLAKDEGKCPIAWENPAWLMAAKWQQEKDEQNKKPKTIAT